MAHQRDELHFSEEFAQCIHITRILLPSSPAFLHHVNMPPVYINLYSILLTRLFSCIPGLTPLVYPSFIDMIKHPILERCRLPKKKKSSHDEVAPTIKWHIHI